jgi:hypothetical protein
MAHQERLSLSLSLLTNSEVAAALLLEAGYKPPYVNFPTLPARAQLITGPSDVGALSAQNLRALRPTQLWYAPRRAAVRAVSWQSRVVRCSGALDPDAAHCHL